ncbi:MAG: aminotransferase class I/II-fold pyridoxal phosphate-dependent enzyme, partial [Lachnospiraceae bacterium]|nr:aminotransferase class I/II-fold pyridoxal phosphate-dependent enzyme [Lachnospiraceae bacterium]
MINETMAGLGRKRSSIRELFEYGKQQAAIVGPENVYDFSLGNPSIPAPPEVDEAIISAVRDLDSISVHGYTSAAGNPTLRDMVTADLNQRYGTGLTSFNIFFTCGAAPSIVSVVKALAVEGSEFIAQAPFFPEYTTFVNYNGGKLVVVPPAYPDFQINLEGMAAAINEHTQGVIINSPNNPTGVIYSEEALKKLAALLTEKEKEYGHPIYIIS